MDLDIDKDSIDAMKEVLKDTPQVPDENATGSTHGSKKHSKPKKRDSAFLYGNEVADILKSAQTPEQKLTTVCNKYSEMLHANRKLMMAYKMAEGRIAKMQQENEQCQQQRSKAVLARSRLENLCRELQKLNKAQKEEIDLKLRLEEEKRKEISATFQSAFAEMNTLTNQNTEKNTKMREENLEMREKIKSVRERIELSEQQLEKVRQQAQLELQLAEAKMAKVKMEMTAEKETLLKEKQQLLLKLTEYQVRIQELQATEVGLRSQISMYTEKYDDFQNALTKSNEVFSGFNEEMEKMSKKILKLEKETSLWKQRWEKSHAALLEMAADKQARDAEMAKLSHKLTLLQDLCKAFQRERAELLAQLRAATHGSSSFSSDQAKINKIDIEQVEELSKDCQELKDNLVQLQGSLEEAILESGTEQINPEADSVVDKNFKTENNETEVNDTPSTSTESNDDQAIICKPLDLNTGASEVAEEPEEKINLTTEKDSHDHDKSTDSSQLTVDLSTEVTETADIIVKSDEESPRPVELQVEDPASNENFTLAEAQVENSPSSSSESSEQRSSEVQENSGVTAMEEENPENQKTNAAKKVKDGKKKKR